MTAKRKTIRQRQLAEIHITVKAIGINRDDYVFMLNELVGVDSSGDIDNPDDMQKVINHLRNLRTRSKLPPSESDPALRKIRKMWSLLVNAGVIRHGADKHLWVWCANQTGVTNRRWLRASHKNQLIEALKSWCNREKVQYDD